MYVYMCIEIYTQYSNNPVNVKEKRYYKKNLGPNWHTHQSFILFAY